MQRLSTLIVATLYIALPGFANPSSAEALTAEQRSSLETLREGEMRKLVIHEDALPASSVAFSNLSGTEQSLSDSNGRIRLVNFWATWCGPCRQEKPSLDALEASMAGPDFSVIAIATGRNDPDAIERFNSDLGIEHLEVFVDPKGTVAADMNVPGLPVTLVLNREGEEIARLMGGADWTSESAKAILNQLIAMEN